MSQKPNARLSGPIDQFRRCLVLTEILVELQRCPECFAALQNIIDLRRAGVAAIGDPAEYLSAGHVPDLHGLSGACGSAEAAVATVLLAHGKHPQ